MKVVIGKGSYKIYFKYLSKIGKISLSILYKTFMVNSIFSSRPIQSQQNCERGKILKISLCPYGNKILIYFCDFAS